MTKTNFTVVDIHVHAHIFFWYENAEFWKKNFLAWPLFLWGVGGVIGVGLGLVSIFFWHEQGQLAHAKKMFTCFFLKENHFFMSNIYSPAPRRGGGWGVGLGLASIFVDVSSVGVSASRAATAALLALTPTLPPLMKTDYHCTCFYFFGMIKKT